MMKRFSIRIMMLAGTCFLLHIIVPHHHHADLASAIEHQRIVECSEGLHHHEAENRHHHHHEELVCEADLCIDETSSQALKALVKTHELLKLLLGGALYAHNTEVPEPHYICAYIAEWNYVPPFYDLSIPLCHGLRAPPAVKG